MRFLQSFIILLHFIISTANDDSNNENVITTPAKLQDPCLLSSIVSDDRGHRPVVVYKCRLQERDSAIFGPRLLDINGLNDSWMNSSPKRHSLQPGRTTLFIDDATISDGKILIPRDKTISDFEVNNPPDYLPHVSTGNRAFGEKRNTKFDLTTAVSGGSTGKGMLFYVTTLNDLCISAFRIHMADAIYTVNIYTKYDSYVDDSDLTDPDWTEVQTVVDQVGAGQGSETELPNLDTPICIPAGSEHGIYIILTPDNASDKFYCDYSGATNKIDNEDGNIQVWNGHLIQGGDTPPTVWWGSLGRYRFEGTIEYYLTTPTVPTCSPTISSTPSLHPTFRPTISSAPSSSISLSPSAVSGDFTGKGILFYVTTTFASSLARLYISAFRIHMADATYTVNIYTNGDSYIGDSDVTNPNWIEAQTVVDQVGAGQGFETELPNLDTPIYMWPGAVRAIYIILTPDTASDAIYSSFTGGPNKIDNDDGNIQVWNGNLIIEGDIPPIGWRDILPWYRFEGTIVYSFEPLNEPTYDTTIFSAQPITTAYTTFDLTTAVSGDSTGKGLLFYVTTLNDLCISAFRIHMADATYTVNIYTKYDSDLTNPDWTEVQTVVDQVGAGQGSETELPNLDTPICIPPGLVQAIYIILTPDNASDAIYSSKHTEDDIKIENDDGNIQVWTGGLIIDGDIPPIGWHQTEYWFRFEGTIEYYLTTPTVPPCSPIISSAPSLLPTFSPTISSAPSSNVMLDTLSPTISSAPSITTSYTKFDLTTAVSGDRPGNGMLIYVTTLNDLCICAFRIHMADVTYTVNIYTKYDSYVDDSDLTDPDWTEVQTVVDQVGAGQGFETELPNLDTPICIPPGSVQGIYIILTPDRTSDGIYSSFSGATNKIDNEDGNIQVWNGHIIDDGDIPPIGWRHLSSWFRFEGTIEYYLTTPTVPSSPSPTTTSLVTESPVPTIAPLVTDPPVSVTCIIDDDCNDNDDCTEDKCINDVCSNVRVLSPKTPICGDLICEDGETCETCPKDCRRRIYGDIKKHFCCYGGPAVVEGDDDDDDDDDDDEPPTFTDIALWSNIATSCEYYKCQRHDRQCDITPALICQSECTNDIDCNDQDSCTKDSCIDGICVYTNALPYIGICGDGICQEGENCENCPQDCRKRIHGASVKHFCCYGGPTVPTTFLDPDTYNPIAISCTDDRCGLYDRICDTTSAIAAVTTDNGATCGTECKIDSDCNDNNICTDDKCIYGICINPLIITYANGWCGDDICQDGENCENCPQDCRQRTWGNNVNKHFCCFGGPPNNKPNFNDPTTYDDIAITCDMYRCQRQSNGCNIFAKRDIPQECSNNSNSATTTN